MHSALSAASPPTALPVQVNGNVGILAQERYHSTLFLRSGSSKTDTVPKGSNRSPSARPWATGRIQYWDQRRPCSRHPPLFHQPHRLDDIPRARLELVVAKAQPSPISASAAVSSGVMGMTSTTPAPCRAPAPQRSGAAECLGLARNIEQCAGESVGTIVRIQSQRILPHKSVGLLLTSRLFAEELAPTLQALIRLHAAEGDVVDLGKVAGDHRDRRDFDFIQLYLSDFTGDLLCDKVSLRVVCRRATMIPNWRGITKGPIDSAKTARRTSWTTR